MNWDDIKFFLAVAKYKTLRKAAKELDVDQATVGRRINSLEKNLGSKLFVRKPTEFSLSDFGSTLLSDVEIIEKKITDIKRKSILGDNDLSGTVSIATTDTIAYNYIIPAIYSIIKKHPRIKIKLSTSVSFSDISSLKSDIAIRGSRPTSSELITKRLATIRMAFYASNDLTLNSSINSIDDIKATKQLIMFNRELVPRHWNTLFTHDVEDSDVALECDSQLMIIEAVKNSVGVGLISKFIAEKDNSLVNILPQYEDSVDIWLVMHPDIKKSSRVRAVIDEIGSHF